jgi:hypothetical protein
VSCCAVVSYMGLSVQAGRIPGEDHGGEWEVDVALPAVAS